MVISGPKWSQVVISGHKWYTLFVCKSLIRFGNLETNLGLLWLVPWPVDLYSILKSKAFHFVKQSFRWRHQLCFCPRLAKRPESTNKQMTFNESLTWHQKVHYITGKHFSKIDTFIMRHYEKALFIAFYFDAVKMHWIFSSQVILPCQTSLTFFTVFENDPKCRIWIFEFWHFHQFLSN